MPKRSIVKRPRDTNQLAKLITDIASGEIVDMTQIETTKKNPAAVALGKLGGEKGGRARMESLTTDERQKLALKGARARWSKKQENPR